MIQQVVPDYQIEDIDPERAQELLGHNTHNRNLRHRVVTSYAADMQAGAWQQNGESIKIAHDGTVIDGQHRLHAIVESGTSQKMLIVRGLPMETQETVDGGAKRTFSDVLRLRKEPNYVRLASVVRRVALWDRGYRRPGQNFVPTVHQMLEVLERYPDIREAAEVGEAVARAVPLSAATTGLCYWAFSRVDDTSNEDAQFFFDRLRDGANLDVKHPIYVLRKTMIGNEPNGHSRISEVTRTALVIKAWNAFRSGTEILRLTYRPGGANPEPFPEPK